MKKILLSIRLTVEALWRVLVLLVNLPIAVVEIIWLRIFDKDRYQARISLLKSIGK